MGIEENLTEFMGWKVKDWTPGEPIGDPKGTAYRISVSYHEGEDGITWEDRFEAFLEAARSPEVTGLVVGMWPEAGMGGNSSDIVSSVVAAHERLPNLRALFIGDMTYEESEISWIEQTDLSRLLVVYPQLEHLGVRGDAGLSFTGATRTPPLPPWPFRHAHLKTLVVESGGLPASVVREIAAADLPELERLELWLGEGNYGGDATVVDLEPILSGRLFPKLRYLGLKDSEIQDEIAAAVAASPVVGRIRVLDLSMGTLTDEGAEALLACPALAKLEKLDLHHHYLSEEMMARLEALGIPVDVSDRQVEDEYGRFVAVGE